MRVWFFGDSRELRLEDPVLVFVEEGVVCDFTECGAYIASKHVAHGHKPLEVPLKEVFNLFDLATPVHAENNGIAHLFEEYNIRTLQDLLVYLHGYLDAK